jgi:hypothetical protein
MDGVLWMTLTCDRNLPNDPAKVGRRCVRNVVRSCPSDRFFCSLGLRAKDISLSALRCLPNGKVKVGACNDGGNSGTSGAGAGPAEAEAEAEAAFSAFSLSCFNLLKYRSEANSVMWRGSMVFCVWPLCPPIAEMKRGVLDTAYQGRGDDALHRRVVNVAQIARRATETSLHLDTHTSWSCKGRATASASRASGQRAQVKLLQTAIERGAVPGR